MGPSIADPNLAANAELILAAILSGRLGLGRLMDATVRLSRGGFAPGRMVLTWVQGALDGRWRQLDAEIVETLRRAVPPALRLGLQRHHPVRQPDGLCARHVDLGA